MAEAPAPNLAPRVAVLVTGKREASLRRFLASYVKPAFGLPKNQWRICYREHYGLTVLSRPLRAGQDADTVYGSHAGAGALVLGCLAASNPVSGREAARAWLKAKGFAPVVELEFDDAWTESERIEQGAEVVNFVNAQCPWRNDPIEDLDDYMEKNNKPFWA